MGSKLAQGRHLILVGYPPLPGQLKSVFSTAEGSLRRAIEKPPYLRYSGWNLPLDGRGEIVRGEFVRVGDTDYRFLEVYRDGTTIFAARADEDYLAWASPRNEQRINATALVESVYNFTSFYVHVVGDFEQKPIWISLRVCLRNL